MAKEDKKSVFGAMKSGEIARERAGNITTAKLPRSVAELHRLIPDFGITSSTVEQRTLNPKVRGSSPR